MKYDRWVLFGEVFWCICRSKKGVVQLMRYATYEAHLHCKQVLMKYLMWIATTRFEPWMWKQNNEVVYHHPRLGMQKLKSKTN